MSVRRSRILLWSATTLMALGAIGAVTAAVLVPYHDGGASSMSRSHGKDMAGQRNAAAVAEQNALPALARFEPLWQLDLRRPLFDPPPPPPPEAPKPPPLTIKLAGTIIEPDGAIAMIVMPGGKVELRKIGDKPGGAEITKIEEGSVTVLYHGQTIALGIEQQQSTGGTKR